MLNSMNYIYIEFYCLDCFRGPQLLMYSGYRKVDAPDGLVEDKGHDHLWDFQDIQRLARDFATSGRSRQWLAQLDHVSV
jgi:hypothetical protein